MVRCINRSNMNLYTYKKRRNEFGRQCIFGETSLTLCEIETNDELKKQFNRETNANITIQNIPQMAEDEVATFDNDMQNVGINHYEGGWPVDIDTTNEDEMAIYRKSYEQMDQYKIQLKSMCTRMEHKIAQNNAMNLFQEYFTDEGVIYGESYKPEIQSISLFECPSQHKIHNAIASNSSIATSSLDKMVVSYTAMSMGQMNINQMGMPSYIWDFNRNLAPILELKCQSSLAQVEYNEKDEFVIAAGQSDGTVAIYDSRVAGNAQLQSFRELSHRECVTALRWTMSKGNVEFFTCANDANVMWWDVRQMDKPHESFQLDFDEAGCSTLDYTFSMPTRFLVGMSNGMIVSGNKRGTTYADRFSYAMKSFSGAVQSLERNPFADKYSLSVGDQSFRLWSDENRETPIMQSIDYSHDLTCGAWNRNRCSNFYVGHSNGTIDVWDLLYDLHKPIATISILNSRVEHIRSHPNGKLVIGSFRNGDVHLIQVSDFLASHQIIEKARLIEMFDRELGREVLFLTKIREQRMLAAQRKDDVTDDDDARKPTVEAMLKSGMDDFEAIIKRESK